MRQRLTAFGMILALLAGGAAASVSADAQTTVAPTPSPQTLSTDCNTQQLSDIIDTYLATPAPGTKARPAPIPAGIHGYLVSVLTDRLQRCDEILTGVALGKNTPSPAQACAPETDNVRQLWRQLNFCAALVHPAPKPAASAIGWQLSLPTEGYRPVIFVIGLGGDPAMSAKLISTLAVYLNDGRSETGYHFDGDAVLIPVPTMTLTDYIKECADSPAVKGAIVVTITATGKGATDEFIRRRSWTAIEANAQYAKCEDRTPSYTWTSDLAKVEDNKVTLTPLTPLAALLMLAAAYEVFAPARTTSTQSTVAFPNPSPIPPAGRTTTIATTNSTTLNASSLTGVATGFFASSISYTNAVAPLTQEPSVDQLTWGALQSIAYELITDMNCWQPAPGNPGANAQDVIGPPRRLPGYNPPHGLNAYTKGEPSAPFCSAPGVSESINEILPGTPKPTNTHKPQN